MRHTTFSGENNKRGCKNSPERKKLEKTREKETNKTLYNNKMKEKCCIFYFYATLFFFICAFCYFQTAPLGVPLYAVGQAYGSV
jgi:hypothetical protein